MEIVMHDVTCVNREDSLRGTGLHLLLACGEKPSYFNL